MDRNIQEVQQKGMKKGFIEEVRTEDKTLLQEFILRNKQEEILWKQKSRIRWLQEGECNTKFFHKATIQHRHGNHMVRLKMVDGTHAETQEELELTLNDFFVDLMEEPDYDRNEA